MWDKVNVGMKMYKPKCLENSTFYLAASSLTTSGPLRIEGWGDCCGIPVASAFAAAHEEGTRQLRAIEGPGIRSVPFDDVEGHC
ncbi:hypothetical protein V8E55_008789 [Tylopilus felleus]